MPGVHGIVCEQDYVHVLRSLACQHVTKNSQSLLFSASCSPELALKCTHCLSCPEPLVGPLSTERSRVIMVSK